MEYAVSISGMSELQDQLADMLETADTSIAKTADFISQSTAQRARAKIRTSPPTGRYYEQLGHRASAPGEPPANLSGFLADSIRWQKFNTTGMVGSVGAGASYATTLEFGGYARLSPEFGGGLAYIEPRPFLYPSFIEALNSAKGKLKKEFEARL